MPCIGRRTLLASAAGLVAGAGLAAAPAVAASPPAPSLPTLLTLARRLLERETARHPLADRVGIVDFAQASRLPRLFLLDLEAGRVSAHLVSHGRGSDPAHTGMLHRFSNEEGSFASSDGAYLTADLYVGKHGRSMRLIGLDPTNSNALARAIVVHAADYVRPEVARAQGKIGRSHGCFAVAPEELDLLLTRLGPGRLLLAGRFSLPA